MRRRIIFPLTTVAAALVVGSGVAFAATISCPNGGRNLCVGTSNDIFTLDGEADEIRCGPGNDVASYDPAPTAGGASPDIFLDDSCETIDDTVN